MKQGTVVPTVIERYTGDPWIYFGKRNLWPEEMRELAFNCGPLERSMHTLAMMIAGNGVKFYDREGNELEDAKGVFINELLKDTTEEDFLFACAYDIAFLNSCSIVVRRELGGEIARLDQGQLMIPIMQGDPEWFGVVGESGSGKSVTSLSIMRLIAFPGRTVDGSVTFDGTELLDLDEEEMRHIRGNRISMIFQQPTTCLNPVFKVGDQIVEALQIHQGLNAQEARTRTVELLSLVGLPDPQRRVSQYPHELSGGQCQRVMIAMALACSPELLIADEPTTALDTTVQAQILALLRTLRQRRRMAVLFVSHDLAVVAAVADRVLVMQGGRVVESGPVERLFRAPEHPYTKALLASRPGGAEGAGRARRIVATLAAQAEEDDEEADKELRAKDEQVVGLRLDIEERDGEVRKLQADIEGLKHALTQV